MAKNTALRTFSGAAARLRSRGSCRDLASTRLLERHAITVWTVVDLLAFERSPSRPLGALQKRRNSLFGANLLAIVVEVDVTALTAQGGPIWTVAAETPHYEQGADPHRTPGQARVKNTCCSGSSWTTAVVTSSCATSTTSKIRTAERRARPARTGTGLTRTWRCWTGSMA